MANLQELLDKRANLWEEAKTFLNDHTDKDGKISAEDVATYERMESDIVELGKNIKRFENQARIDAELCKPTTQPILPNPQNNYPFKAIKPTATDEYKQAFSAAIRTTHKQAFDLLQENVGSDGGYLVPDEWDDRIIQALTEENIMRQLGTTIQTTGEHKINLVVSTPSAEWTKEGASIVFSNSTYGQITLDAYKVAKGTQITFELLQDQKYDLETRLIEDLSKQIANTEESAFLIGAPTSDTGLPTGLFTTAAANSDNIVTTATTDTKITADDIIDLVYKLKRPYRKNSVFIMNDTIIAQVRKLKDNNQAFIWQPSYQAGEPDTLLGYKIYTSAYAPTPARGAAVIAFGDMSYYNIADRGTRTFQTLYERFADEGKVGYIMTERVDGKLALPEAVTVLKLK